MNYRALWGVSRALENGAEWQRKERNPKLKERLPDKGKCAILSIWENHRAKGGFTPPIFGG